MTIYLVSVYEIKSSRFQEEMCFSIHSVGVVLSSILLLANFILGCYEFGFLVLVTSGLLC